MGTTMYLIPITLFWFSTLTWPIDARKNVLMLVVDDLRPEIGAWSGVNSAFYRHIHTPNLDSLAARSLVLKHTYAQQARCNPSRTSLLTGRRPESTKIYDLKSYFRTMAGNFTTLPQYFKNHGYQSIGVGKVFHWGRGSNYGDPPSWSVPYYHADRKYWKGKSQSWYSVPSTEREAHPLQDDLVAERAIETIRNISQHSKEQGDAQPFFLAVGFHKPHLPFIVPEEFYDMYPMEDIQISSNPHVPENFPEIAWAASTEVRGYRDIKALHLSGAYNTTFPIDTARTLRRAYYASVTYIDHLIGEILKELSAQSLDDDTIIAFWSDHGFLLGEHGMWAKNSTFELATLTPMMIHVPRVTENGINTNRFTELIDMYPTLVELAGLPPLPQCPAEDPNSVLECHEGTSFAPLFPHPERQWKPYVFSLFPRQNRVMGYSIRSEEGYRYTSWVGYNPRAEEPIWSEVIGEELYNHNEDSGENLNLAYSRSPEIRGKKRILRRKLHLGWRFARPQHVDLMFDHSHDVLSEIKK